MTIKKLLKLTNHDLVKVYNGLNPDKSKPLGNWKGKKDVLAKRILKLQKVLGKKTGTSKPKDTAKTKARSIKPKATGNASLRTIRSAALEHLCHVAYYENRNEKPSPDNVVSKGSKNARSVGLSYGEILDLISDEFPGCKTSAACLRWYSVKVRVEELGYEGLVLPQRRPRAKPRVS